MVNVGIPYEGDCHSTISRTVGLLAVPWGGADRRGMRWLCPLSDESSLGLPVEPRRLAPITRPPPSTDSASRTSTRLRWFGNRARFMCRAIWAEIFACQF